MNYQIIVEPIFNLIETLKKQIFDLTFIREALLSKLISGDIDLSELDIIGVSD